MTTVESMDIDFAIGCSEFTRLSDSIGWDDPRTVFYYEQFCERHTRYTEANATLIAHADLRAGLSVMDFAAGTGRTAEAALPYLGGS